MYTYSEYQSAEQDDLWQYLTNAAHEDGTLPRDATVKIIMDTWTLQMGFPTITVTRSSDGKSATITQVQVLAFTQKALVPRQSPMALHLSFLPFFLFAVSLVYNVPSSCHCCFIVCKTLLYTLYLGR